MIKPVITILISFFLFAALSKAQANESPRHNTRNKKTAKIEYGTASFYHDKFNGRQTANGEVFNQTILTAAHNSLPFGTWLLVTNTRNNKTVLVKVNDRMHKSNSRIVDLSSSAAKELGLKGDSIVPVKVEVLGKKKPANLKKVKQ